LAKQGFKRDYRNAKSMPRYKELDGRLTRILELLVADLHYPRRHGIMPCPENDPVIGSVMSIPTCC